MDSESLVSSGGSEIKCIIPKREGNQFYQLAADFGRLGRLAGLYRRGAQRTFGTRFLHGNDRDHGRYGCGRGDPPFRRYGSNPLCALSQSAGAGALFRLLVFFLLPRESF